MSVAYLGFKGGGAGTINITRKTLGPYITTMLITYMWHESSSCNTKLYDSLKFTTTHHNWLQCSCIFMM